MSVSQKPPGPTHGAGINPCPGQSQLWSGFPKAVPFLGWVTKSPRCLFLLFHGQEEMRSKTKLSKLFTSNLEISPLGMFSTSNLEISPLAIFPGAEEIFPNILLLLPVV